MRLLLVNLLFLVFVGFTADEGRYTSNTGTISFTSDAPLELIKASSEDLQGVIDPATNSFAFAVKVNTLKGFNSALQMEHFNENYLESAKFPKATFSGKIIEQIDFSVDGTYVVRAKGKLKIHGIEQVRIIKGKIKISGNEISVKTDFFVPLADHDITIPKIVNKKIATEIEVFIDAVLTKV